jgi:hypothetical protein
MATLPKFDAVIAIGLLHHLDDDDAVSLMRLTKYALAPEGRLISYDPVLDSEQSSIARFLVSHDRGQNVRTAVGYRALAENVFSDVNGTVGHRHCIPGVPYTNFIMECKGWGFSWHLFESHIFLFMTTRSEIRMAHTLFIHGN